jgi:hypothetical protein
MHSCVNFTPNVLAIVQLLTFRCLRTKCLSSFDIASYSKPSTLQQAYHPLGLQQKPEASANNFLSFHKKN